MWRLEEQMTYNQKTISKIELYISNNIQIQALVCTREESQLETLLINWLFS
jgi:hypothetical protein